MYSGLNSLFAAMGMRPREDVSGGAGFPPASDTRTEEELRMLATAFIMTVENRTPVRVTYHPYQPPVDDDHGGDRVALPAHIDISFRDPRGKTHVVEFSGHDRLSHHSHYFHESNVLDPSLQPGYLMRKQTLNEALDYLNEMHPRWELKHRVLVP